MAAATLVKDLRKFDAMGQSNPFSYVFSGYVSFKPEIAQVERLDDELRWMLSEASNSKFYRVPLLDAAGLITRDSKTQDTGDRLLFYKRAEVEGIWKSIDNVLASEKDFKCLFVKGQPGTGKSTAIWWKILSMSAKDGGPKNMLWVSLGRDGEPKPQASVYFQGTNYYKFRLKRKQIYTFLGRVPVELVVIDGMAAKAEGLIAEVIAWMKDEPERHAIISSSSKVEDPRPHENEDITFDEVYSWKLEEFFNAFVQGEEPTAIYDRCSSLLYEEFGLGPSEIEETDSGVKLSLEDIRGKAEEIGEALEDLAKMEASQESVTATSVIPSDTNALAPEEPNEAKAAAYAAAAPAAPEEEDQKADNQSLAERTLRPSVAKGPKTSDDLLADENGDHEVGGDKDSDDNESSNKRQKMLSKADIFKAIRGRYKYSGGSARWMFNYSRDQMDDRLDGGISNLRIAMAFSRNRPPNEELSKLQLLHHDDRG